MCTTPLSYLQSLCGEGWMVRMGPVVRVGTASGASGRAMPQPIDAPPSTPRAIQDPSSILVAVTTKTDEVSGLAGKPSQLQLQAPHAPRSGSSGPGGGREGRWRAGIAFRGGGGA